MQTLQHIFIKKISPFKIGTIFISPTFIHIAFNSVFIKIFFVNNIINLSPACLLVFLNAFFTAFVFLFFINLIFLSLFKLSDTIRHLIIQYHSNDAQWKNNVWNERL